MNFDLAVDNMKRAARDIGRALRESNGIQESPLIESLSRYDDELRISCNKKAILGLSRYIDLFKMARYFITVGDRRYINFARLCDSQSETIKFLVNANKASHGQINLIQNLYGQTQHLFNRQRADFDKKEQG